jgi:cell fate (sporulation/competence/biofilm development) regulator YlbF (YheA/YmcA/DUF963 family)
MIMDIIKMTRELGKAIQQDERYAAYMAAKQANDNDEELQKLKSEERLKTLDEELKSIYAQIMGNDGMIAFNTAQNELEQLISDVNQIITMCANGEDPDTCEIQHGCSGSCSTCGGCH